MHVYWYGLSVFKYKYCHILYAFEFNTLTHLWVMLQEEVMLCLISARNCLLFSLKQWIQMKSEQDVYNWNWRHKACS